MSIERLPSGNDKIAFWIGDTPETVRSVYAHMLEDSSAPAAAAIDSVFASLRKPHYTAILRCAGGL